MDSDPAKATQHWLQRKYGLTTEVITHLDEDHIQQIKPGDTIIGNLPEHLASKLCEQGAHYCVINLNYANHPELRGRDLNQKELDQLNPTIERYHVTHVGSGIPEAIRNHS